MKAIVCNEWCKPEDLKVSEIKNPTLDDNSVRVEIHASGVNFPDVLRVSCDLQNTLVFNEQKQLRSKQSLKDKSFIFINNRSDIRKLCH